MKLIKPILLTTATMIAAIAFPFAYEWYKTLLPKSTNLMVPNIAFFFFWAGMLCANVMAWCACCNIENIQPATNTTAEDKERVTD